MFGDIQVELYEHVNYRGFKKVYTNNVPWVGKAVNDKFSSLKVKPAPKVCLYQHALQIGSAQLR